MYILYCQVQVPPVTLEWSNLSCHWTSKKQKKQQRKGEPGSKQILFNLSGAARPGRCASIAQLQELLVMLNIIKCCRRALA
jgi:hypothetical protein